MTSVTVRFEEMTASHRFELQSETKDDNQQSRNLGNVSRGRCRKPKKVLINSPNLKKLLLLKKNK